LGRLECRLRATSEPADSDSAAGLWRT
jgi:hypothetical protein